MRATVGKCRNAKMRKRAENVFCCDAGHWDSESTTPVLVSKQNKKSGVFVVIRMKSWNYLDVGKELYTLCERGGAPRIQDILRMCETRDINQFRSVLAFYLNNGTSWQHSNTVTSSNPYIYRSLFH